jgi:hypothetical protein
MLAGLIVTITIGGFAYYVATHPATVTQLKEVPLTTLVGLLCLYGGSFIAYALVTRGSLRIYQKTMSRQENILFNAYSSLVNFLVQGRAGQLFVGCILKNVMG